MSWDAEDYARNSGAQARWALELIGKLALAGAEHVLDVGSGDGKITAELARRVPEGSVLGIDSSPEMVAAAPGGVTSAGRRGVMRGPAARHAGAIARTRDPASASPKPGGPPR